MKKVKITIIGTATVSFKKHMDVYEHEVGELEDDFEFASNQIDEENLCEIQCIDDCEVIVNG